MQESKSLGGAQTSRKSLDILSKWRNQEWIDHAV